MAVTSSEAFLKVLKKSGLLSEEEFDEVHQKYGGEDDPKGIARTLIKVGKINKWQALQLLSGRHALTLSKYKLLDQIGSDQSTRTYLAEHAQMGRRVAIKTLSRRQATEAPELTKRFVDQATKLAALDHRNIIHAYDVDSGDDRLYVVLEHVEGLSLKQMLDEQGAMPAEKVAHYVSQTAAGLAYAHKHGHTHGDIRPANLLVDNQDVVKIANLGVGGLTTSEQDDGSEAASTAYVAPEQSADEASGDHRSDIYSLGCVMYALLTGHPPASDGSGPPSVLDERPDVHRLLATICGRMMAHDANDRYQAAGDIEQQLDQWLKLVADAKPASSHSQAASEGEPADAASDSQPPKAAAPPPRKRVQDKKAPEQKKPSPAPEEPQVVADSPAKPKRTAASTKPAAASAKPGEPGKAKKDAEAKAKPGVAVAAASGVPAADSAAKPQEPAPADAASKKPAGAAAKESKLPGMPEIPVTEAKPSIGAAGGVAINTKGKRRRKKGKPGKAGAVAAADGAESGSKTAYIIGGAIAGGAVLVGGVILLIVLFSGGDEDDIELAEGGNGEAAAKDTDTTGTDSDGEVGPESDPESDPVLAAETDPVMVAETDPVPDGTSQESDPESTDDVASGAATSKPTDEPGTSDAAGKTDSATQSKVGEGDAAKAPTSPEEKPVEKKPAEKPAEKPAAEKPEAKKQPAKPSKKPFVDLPTLVSLPELNSADAMKPKNLGKIHAASDELCFIKLRGGENASRGDQRFVMRNADGGLAERDWEVFSRENESAPETKIAHLSLGDNSQFSFQWQPEAKTQTLSAHLSNCAFSFSCRGESQIALLRQPTRVDGLAVDFEKSTTKADWDIDNPPDPSAIRVEIAGVQGGKYSVEPAPTMDADKGEAWVKLEDGGGLLSLQVETSLKSSLQVTLTPHVKLVPNREPERLNKRKITQLKTQGQQAVQNVQNMVAYCEQRLKAKGVSENEKKRMLQPRLATFRSQLETAKAGLQKVESLEKLLDNASLTVNLRVFFDAGSTQVDLLRIGG